MDTSHPTSRQPGGRPVIGLISNPHSGRNRRALEDIGRIVADYPGVHHRMTGDIGEVADVLEEFAAAKVEVLAINGGDGTIAGILTALLEQRPFDTLPRLAILPGGTTNMNAGDVGLRGSPARAVRRLCEWGRGERTPVETLRRPVLRITSGDGQPAVCGMAFGTGTVIQGIEYFHERVNKKGIGSQFGAAAAILRTFWGIARRDRRFLKPVAVAVQRNEEPSGPTSDILFMLVSGLERMYFGLRPFWGTEDAPLYTTLVRDDARRFLRNMPALLRGRPNRHMNEATGYSSYNADRLRLHMDGLWALDGELYRASTGNGPVTISNAATMTFIRV
jgi:diacylglycerol kinase family enzyme